MQITLMQIFILIIPASGKVKVYVSPLEIEAQTEMFVAEQYFAKDSFNLALNGDGNYPGFIEIAEDYSVTKAGNLANCTKVSYESIFDKPEQLGFE